MTGASHEFDPTTIYGVGQRMAEIARFMTVIALSSASRLEDYRFRNLPSSYSPGRKPGLFHATAQILAAQPSHNPRPFKSCLLQRPRAANCLVKDSPLTQMTQLNERLDFFGLDDAAKKNLIALKPVIEGALPAAFEAFYEKIVEHPHTRSFFPERSKVPGLAARQTKHWNAMVGAQLDEKYLTTSSAVGRAHATIGLEPRWYIGGYALILERLIVSAIEARWPKGIFAARRSNAHRVALEISALVKVALLDMDMAISVYLKELADARDASESERSTGEEAQRQILDLLGDGLRLLAQGDLTTKMDASVNAKYEAIKSNFNAAVEELAAAMSTIGAAAHGLHGMAQEITVASDDLSRRTEKQAATLEETSSALNQITEAVTHNANDAKEVAAIAAGARIEAEKSAEVIKGANSAMAEIKHSFEKITGTLSLIDEIALQTNLLALNAGVEAARAGEAGRGFAVVAQEVRVLAQRSAEAAKAIKQLLASSSAQIDHGVRSVAHTGDALGEIARRVSDIDKLVGSIAMSSQDQSLSLSEINKAVAQMDQVTQQNAAMVEEATAVAMSLKGESSQLSLNVARFRTRDSFDQEETTTNSVAKAQARIADAFTQGRAANS